MPTVSRAKMERALPFRDPRPKGTAQRLSIERQMPSGKTADRQHSVAKTAKLATVSPVPIVCAVKLQLREDDEACTKTPNVPSSLSTSASSTPRYHPSTPPSPGSAAFGLPNKSFGREFHAQRKLRMGEDAGRTKLQRGSKADKIVPEGMVAFYPEKREPKKRCAWITSQSDAAYVSYHDEEWGVPLHDDKRLFELLVLGGAQAEISWSTILSKREVYRDAFAAFDPAVLATYDDEAKMATLKTQGDVMRSDARIESIVNNAKLVLKIAEEFGSFGHYLWSFLNYKPIGNSYRHPNFIPVKNAKSEAISKDLQKRGFRHAGPMVVYSLMQAAGMTNDHLVNCFRYKECKILEEQQQQHHQQQQQQRQHQMISSKVQGQNQLQGRRKPHKPFASSPVCC